MESSRLLTPRAVHVPSESAIPGGAAGPRRLSRRPLYQPWILGPVVMVQTAPRDRWTVELTDQGRLLPAMARGWREVSRRIRQYRARGVACRAAAALVTPADAEATAWSRGGPDEPVAPEDHRRGRRGRLPLEMYGWSLMIGSPQMPGRAIVDRHDHFPDLPACFELPQELIDRTEYLAAHGIASRPLALVTAIADFDRGVDGRWRNRFAPAARFHAARVA